MSLRAVALVGLIALAAALAWQLPIGPVGAQAGEPKGAADIAQGKALYDEYCASCHGANLEGQPDWQLAGSDGRLPAPPHDASGHTWHHGDRLLSAYIRLGGAEALARRGVEFDSGMPAFGDVLSDAQIADILAYVKSTWPPRIRAMQAERTTAEQDGD